MKTRWQLDNECNLDTKFTALALLYGPPDIKWHTFDVKYGNFYYTYGLPVLFRQALVKIYGAENVARVGVGRMAYDYAAWYQLNSGDNNANTQ